MIVLICTQFEMIFVKSNTFMKIKIMCCFNEVFVNMKLGMKIIYDEISHLTIAQA
jgi:hypothetical protein